jgi:hypothetical protein
MFVQGAGCKREEGKDDEVTGHSKPTETAEIENGESVKIKGDVK